MIEVEDLFRARVHLTFPISGSPSETKIPAETDVHFSVK